MNGLGQTIMMEAMERGMQEGIQQGENLLALLIQYLLKDGRLGDLEQISDEKKRQKLYKEYGLID